MKRRLIIGLCFVSIVALAAIYFYPDNNDRDRKFIDQAFVQLNGGVGDEHIRTIELESGEGFQVILEHACCSGAGFDAVAIKTSDGVEYCSNNNYCGLEGFYHEVMSHESKNLEQFKSYLESSGYQKK
jgi:hypothetical protein